MSTKAELEAQVEELRQQLAAPQPPPRTGTLAVSYNLVNGALQGVAASHTQSADELRAMKAALAMVAQQTDMLLLRAVEREATEAARK